MSTLEKTSRHNWRPFEEARAFVRSLRLKIQDEWIAWARSEARPEDIPADPRKIYKNDGWAGMGDWLGNRNRKGGYRPFQEAREFARGLGLLSSEDWNAWAKSEARPEDIPASPATVYKDHGWTIWSDWLGTRRRRGRQRSFREARSLVRSLGLRNKDEWVKWCKSDARPEDIPASPHAVYKGKGWAGWGDWLGTDRIPNQNRVWRSFEEARAFVRSLRLQNQADWIAWAKSEACPDDIPAKPRNVYKDAGWVSMGDWLGTGNIAPKNMRWRPFAEARAFVHTVGILSKDEWGTWARSAKRPNDIPASPSRVYERNGWIGWGDWLGTGRIASFNLIYRAFSDARKFARDLGLQNRSDWARWAISGNRPGDIPTYPDSAYKNEGWAGWSDWLDTGRISPKDRVYRSFQEARTFVRSLALQSKDEWSAWAKSDARPEDIPSAPARVYQDDGWTGMGDWLGIVNLWNRNAVLSFLNGIKPVLRHLQPAELFAIMRQNGLIASTRHANNTTSQLIKSIRDLCSSPDPETDFEELVAEIEEQNAALDDEGIDAEAELIPEVVLVEEEAKQELPTLRSLAALKAVDALVEAGITSDEETIEFLVANRVNGLWQAALNAELTFDLDTLRAETGGTYFNTIRSRFLSQYDGAQALEIPIGYDFYVEGRLADPNLMQRLTAYRVLTERRLGNWSGVGAGKTLSAILASRVIDAHLTVVVAFNSTVTSWATRIIETYPDSKAYVKERGEVRVDRAKHTYLVLNFETFQQPDSAAMVRRLVEKHQIDFVVLDEIQSVKQRTPKVTSKRRQVVSGLLSAASERNPDLCVLGMSATPVINNLYEAKALLELVKGVEFSDLQTYSSIANASAMHEKLILYGIRYRPQYAQTIETTLHEIPGADYLPRLRGLKKGAILDLERVLLDAKLETIIGALKKGTLIYMHYLTGLIGPLRRAIEKSGFKVGVFTGDDKSGLQPFIIGKVDVLIGSVPVGTGVDGLQYVCNRSIIVSLPWTSAEYEQLIGRLYRQGSVFDKVEVIIPQVVLAHNGDMWSWDKLRLHRIQYKKTLTDAALDGVIPEGELSSPETMFKQAREALQAWITRVEQDDVTVIERAKLRVPLPTEDARRIQRRFGNLSTMNARLNTAYSKTTHDRLRANPEEWYLYHTLYREARQTWAEIPYEKIAASLRRRPDWIVGDFGCGEAQLAALLPNKVYSFDHVAINDTVIACDMTHTPLDDSTLDVAVFSLSLMGLNYAEYLKEAQRTLRFGGFLKIAEPISRWANKRSKLLSVIADAGFLIVGQVEETGQFFYIDAIKMEK
jgi:hypothetical protein